MPFIANTYHHPTKELIALLDVMNKTNVPFNAAILSKPGDADCLALMDNGVGWEACCETGKYDLWFNGHMEHWDLTVEQAAKILITKYQEGKMNRVYTRIIKGSQS